MRYDMKMNIFKKFQIVPQSKCLAWRSRLWMRMPSGRPPGRWRWCTSPPSPVSPAPCTCRGSLSWTHTPPARHCRWNTPRGPLQRLRRGLCRYSGYLDNYLPRGSGRFGKPDSWHQPESVSSLTSLWAPSGVLPPTSSTPSVQPWVDICSIYIYL